MEVFGFMRLEERAISRGASKIFCHPTLALEHAGWSKTYKGFVPELSWNTDTPLWQLQPERAALIARCESLCEMDAVELLSVGRKLGVVGRDSRLRHAMNVLHLTEQQLAVPVNEKDLPVYKSRWLEVLDYLLNIKPYTKTKDLHSKLCLLENTVSSSIMDRWLNKQTWACGPRQMIVGDCRQLWNVDLCSPDLRCRLLASHQSDGFYIVAIQAGSFADLQDPNPGMLSVHRFDNRGSFMESLRTMLDSRQINAAKELPSKIAQQYQGQPIASALVGLKAPRMRLKIGRVAGWEMTLPVSYTRPADQTYLEALLAESPSDLGLPLAAFKSNRPNTHTADDLPPERLMARVHVAKLHTLPGGLMRTDFPAVTSRGEERPPSIELYHPLNPFSSC